MDDLVVSILVCLGLVALSGIGLYICIKALIAEMEEEKHE